MDWSRFWLRRSGIHRLLSPLAWAFQRVAWHRRNAYLSGRKKQFRAPVPVIIVGNIYVGGAGKTPLVIKLVEELSSR